MEEKQILSGLVIGDKEISFIQVCKLYHISENWLEDLLKHGLIDNTDENPKNLTFDEKLLTQIQKAHRFHEDLDVNIPGVMVILDLLEELENTKEELDILKRHIKL